MMLTRRYLLAASAATPFAGCLGAFAAPPAPNVADAHVHLFNASDLPVRNFVKYVMIPRFTDGTSPGWARAVVDFIAFFVLPRAVTAEQEMASLTGGNDLAMYALTAREFGDEAGRFVVRRARARDKSANGLPASYWALLHELDAAPVGDPSLKGVETEAAVESAFTAIAMQIEAGTGMAGDRGDADNKAAGTCPTSSSDKSAKAIIGWAYAMLKSRANHIRDYLKHYSGGGRAVIANHLVDYDYWLDDAPSRCSPHRLQIDLMARLAERFLATADIRTFAGFCPLRLAIERLRGKPGLFDWHKVQGAKVAGFKLYPPMGFLPTGNAAFSDADFRVPYGGFSGGLVQWRKRSKAPLGPALDAALDEFYRHCATTRTPLMAHAGPGNEAGPGFGLRANPKHWELVARQYELRLSLGHLVNDVSPFVDAVESGQADLNCVWSLDAPLRMLDLRNASYRAQVFGDLGYMPELIHEQGLSRRFFEALRKAFGPGDPDLTRILYGTDWIMVAHERDSRRFLECVVAGMNAASYSERQKDNILRTNARRLLNETP